MTDAEKLAFKSKLKQWGLDLIGQRILTSTEAMDAAQQAANNEEKSSAGDKYETSRAMGHLQKDMHARQLAESVKELAALHAVSVESIYTTGRIGAFLEAGEIERGSIAQDAGTKSASFDQAGATEARSLIQAADIGFFISCGLGKQVINGRTILFLSPAAPLAGQLSGAKPGDPLLFNQRTMVISNVF